MGDAIRITLIVAAIILLIAGATAQFFLRTSAGHAALKPLLEDAIAKSVGGDVAIGDIAGALPGDVTATGVVLTDGAGKWLVIDRATLQWRPLALIRGRVEIVTAEIDGATIYAPPPKRENKNRPRGFELPDALPALEIANLRIANFRLADTLAGEPVRLDGSGKARMGGKMLDVVLNAASTGERDFVSVKLLRDGDALSTEATIAGKRDGVIVALTGLGGDVFVETKGQGPLDAYVLSIDARLGALGDVNAELSADFATLSHIAFDGDAKLGERLHSLSRQVGGRLAAKGIFTPAERGGGVEFASLRGAFGELSGTADWRNEDGALDRLVIAAQISFAVDWRPDIQRYLGDSAVLNTTLSPDGEAWRGDATLAAPRLKAAARDIKTDLREFAKGPAEITLASNTGLPPPIQNGLTASGDVVVTFDEGVSGTGLRIATPEGATFNGEASLRFANAAFAAKGDVAATPTALASMAPLLVAQKPASAVVDLKGTPENFAGQIVATTPAMSIDRRPFPPARFAIAFTNAPAAIAGTASGRALDGSARLRANFARAHGFWRANAIDYVGDNFTLQGAASFNPDTKEGAVDLAYRGEEGAEPWPGVVLSGDVVAKGAVSRGAVTNRLALRADAAKIGNLALTRLNATAQGPADALSITATADAIATVGVAPVADLSAAFVLSSEGIDLRALTGEMAGAALNLKEPARLRFGEAISVDNLRASIGKHGSFAFDGAIEKSRWRGILAVRSASIVSAASIVDLDLDLDTNRPGAATGAFRLTPQIGVEPAKGFAGALAWDGRSLHLTDAGEQSAIDLDLRLPAKLVRGSSLSISTKGELEGTMRYEGRAETISVFLPSALQSIEGALSLKGEAKGTLAAPVVTGVMKMTNGAYTEPVSGLSIIAIEGAARASAAHDASQVDFDFNGSGPGQTAKTILVKGTASLGANGRLTTDITLDKARLSAGPISHVVATGVVNIAGAYDDMTASGEINIRDLSAEAFTPERSGLVDIAVVNVEAGAASMTARERPDALQSLTYALRIKGSEKLVIGGRGLNSDWRADVTLTGRADAPVLIGTLTMIEGHIDFASRRFDMARGSIDFDRLTPNNPSLDMRAERDTKSGTTAIIAITGRANAPKITLSSSPSLPQEEIMALVLFDKPATELTALQSLQVADGLAELGGIGPFGGKSLTGATRDALGLDMLNIELGEADSSASKLTVGKYVTDGLFVSATQDARGENGSVRIEYEINESFTVETELRQDGDQTVSANWKHDF